jgi:ABC-type Fe3+-hydroxamate transport system substrate-binding protein
MTGGNGQTSLLSFTEAPRRVVSLVPSMTESLFDLGAGEALVGVTEFCRPPATDRERLAVVGGTRSVDAQAVVRLKPDLVMANQEENSREVVESLEASGLKVWVTFPRSVDEAIQVLWALVRLFRLTHAQAKIQTLELTTAWTARAAAAQLPIATFVPIWEGEEATAGRWWMTVNRGTYVHDLLAICGAANVFADRDRRYPLAADVAGAPSEERAGRDTRYPRVTCEEVLQRAPELILLPSEPYAFGETDALRMAESCEEPRSRSRAHPDRRRQPADVARDAPWARPGGATRADPAGGRTVTPRPPKASLDASRSAS